MISITEIQERHRDFVELINGWGSKTPLESTALICEEIGELTHELRQQVIDLEKVGAELADIILRAVDLAREMGIDIENSLISKIDENFRNIDAIKAKGRIR